jgi:hypothetical protein
MTREDVIRMMDEAKLTCVAEMFESELERFAALVAAAEREECAKQLNALGNDHCAAAIRARSKA